MCTYDEVLEKYRLEKERARADFQMVQKTALEILNESVPELTFHLLEKMILKRLGAKRITFNLIQRVLLNLHFDGRMSLASDGSVAFIK